MNRATVLVVGSINMDMVLTIERMPAAGENLFVRNFSMYPGGKGHNQTIACARLGAEVSIIGKVGDDDFGERLLLNLEQENVNYNFVTKRSMVHTGLAFIFIDDKGESRILVAPGANMELDTEDLEKGKQLFKVSDFLILQLEIPYQVVCQAIEIAHHFGVRVVLNPAPAQHFPIEMLLPNDIITPNQYEAEILSGVKINTLKDAVRSMQVLEKRCPAQKVITLGQDGALASLDERRYLHLLPRKVKVEDTTAAGDAFNAGLVMGIATKKDWIEALKLANNAGAIACTKLGAQSALPYMRDIEQFVSRWGEGEVEIIDG